MITQDQLKTLSQKYQTTQLNIRREYTQHLFLSYFYQQPESNRIYFKGGTALKILYNSPRFSEDLDFSTTHSNKTLIEKMLHQAISSIEKEGVTPRIIETKTTSGGYLSRLSFDLYDQSIEVLLQISLREGKKKGELLTIVNDFIPPYTTMALLREQMIAEKILALLSRMKPRDFYDLYFILRANLLPAKEKKVLEKIYVMLDDVKINFDRELRHFLPKSHWPIIRDFKSVLKRELQRYL